MALAGMQGAQTATAADLPCCPPSMIFLPAPLLQQGGALGSVACTLGQHHPTDPQRPLIDYRLALVITPTLLLGCNTGVGRAVAGCSATAAAVW